MLRIANVENREEADPARDGEESVPAIATSQRDMELHPFCRTVVDQ